MVGRKRTTTTHPTTTPHRLRKRCATRITATPRNVISLPNPRLPKLVLSKKKAIDMESDEWWALDLPTSPAPSPPIPKEICPRFNCSLVPSPNETQLYAYRKLYNEHDQTLKDALGREIAGRHSFPAREFTRDRFYMTPSTRAKEAHGIFKWPDPPFQAVNHPAEGDRSMDVHGNYTPPPTPFEEEPENVGVHTTGRKIVNRRPVRLFSDESVKGSGGNEGRDGHEDNVKRKEKDDTAIHTALAAQGDTATSSSRKRRASKNTIKMRRCLYPGSVNSDGVRVMTSSEEEVNDGGNEGDDEEIDENENEVSDESISPSGDLASIENEGEGDLNRTLEVEKDESDMGEEGSGSKKRKSSMRVDEEDDMMQGDGVRVDGSEEREEEEGNDRREDEDEMEEVIDEDGPAEGEELSSDHEGTLREEMSESEEDDYDSDVLERSLNNKGDISLIDNTLPLESVDDSIVDENLRRMLAVCKQKNVMDIDEFMSRVESAVKVGEGSFADAYLVKREWEQEKKVFKIMALRNEETEEIQLDDDDENPRKKEEDAEKVFGEVVISKDLTRLGRSGRNSTSAFAKLYRARVIQGIFPPLLSDAWKLFRENDEDAVDELNPSEYGEDQLFLVLECEYGGLSLKKFPFSSILEIVSVYCQTALALAVAESEFKFEHRDLHEDNVLVKRTEDDFVDFTYDCQQENGDHSGVHQSIRVPTHGVKTTIIDFTLSRITRRPGRRSTADINVYHELTEEQCHQEETAEQYTVYKKMHKLTKGDWVLFTPKSNVLWLRMQMNWLIANNLNPKSELNEKRKDGGKSRKTIEGVRKQSKRHSKRKSTKEEEEGTEMSGETWIKHIKAGKKFINLLKEFPKSLQTLDSAQAVVASKNFKALLALLG